MLFPSEFYNEYAIVVILKGAIPTWSAANQKNPIIRLDATIMLVVESLLLTKFLRINTMLPKILICFERVILSSTRMQWISLRINYIAVVKDNVKKQLRTRALTKNATLQKYLTKMLIYEINFKCFWMYFALHVHSR